jgi:hypothetical protein
MTSFDEIAKQAKERREMRNDALLNRIARNMAELEEVVARYRSVDRRYREKMLDKEEYWRYLANRDSYYDDLNQMRFAEALITELLGQITLDRAAVEAWLEQDTGYADWMAARHTQSSSSDPEVPSSRAPASRESLPRSSTVSGAAVVSAALLSVAQT